MNKIRIIVTRMQAVKGYRICPLVIGTVLFEI